MRDTFIAQVQLLVKCLPNVAGESVFALKGGTAINLFHRDLPRLSVDIDLVYLPIHGRGESLAAIRSSLERIADEARRRIPEARVEQISSGVPGDTRLIVRCDNAAVKIETSSVMRGTVHPPESRRVREAVEGRFGFAEAPVLSFSDLFAGKLVAALDRQHPRDLFDVMLLLDHEGSPA